MDPAPQTLNNFFPHQKTVVFDLENVVTKKAITRTYEERLDNSNCTGVTLREIISLCASQRLPSVLVLARSSNNKTYRCFTYDSFHRENNWNFKSFFYYTATPLSNGLRADYCGQFEKKPTGIITYQEKSSQDQIFLLNQIFRVMQEKTPYSKYRLSNAYERLNYPLHASHWLQIAALENYPNAHYRIFLRSLKIKPLKIDLVSLQKAAFGGHKNAQFEYARYLYKNDPKKAFEFCLKAGRQGHVGAQIRLWKCYSGY
ncbi:MAG TPA: hypothetical protein PLC42_06095, partial [Parachlamydiaceae bacterium]|nr:hypothetical protein [Parachlamydiaceae bacterium]